MLIVAGLMFPSICKQPPVNEHGQTYDARHLRVVPRLPVGYPRPWNSLYRNFSSDDHELKYTASNTCESLRERDAWVAEYSRNDYSSDTGDGSNRTDKDVCIHRFSEDCDNDHTGELGNTTYGKKKQEDLSTNPESYQDNNGLSYHNEVFSNSVC